MAVKLYQYRYYGDNDNRNQPTNLTKEQLLDPISFDLYYPISQLGIQAKPGTKFCLNSGLYDIIVGSTGIYDLDLTTGARITSLAFNEDTFSTQKWQQGDYIIIDIVYGG